MAYREAGVTTQENKQEIATQTKKVHRGESDDEYGSEEEEAMPKDDFEVTGLDKFLDRVCPRLF